MKKANLFEKIPIQLKEELFEEILSSKNVKIERIVSKGHTSPKSGWYDQEKSEWVVVLQGEAVIAFEDEQIHLNAGDYLTIPAHTKHKVLWTLPEFETIWLAVHY
jgi:cupin 2 domain-containing protein